MSEDPSPRRDEFAGAAEGAAGLAGALTVTAPPSQAGRSVPVEPNGTTVGRDASCDLALASEHIGQHQAVVCRHGNLYVVEDLGSTTQTLLNGVPVTGIRPLHDGDHLTFADVEVEFQMTAAPATQPQQRRAQERKTPLHQELREAPGFSSNALLLAVLGAVVSTALTGAAGAGPWGTLVGAAIGPVVTTTFTTRKAGEKGRVRTAAIVILSLAAIVITVVGFGIADRAAGRSVIPGSEDRPSTFPQPGGAGGPAPSPTATGTSPQPTFSTGSGPVPAVEPQPLSCDSASVGTPGSCPVLTITNVGDAVLTITGVEVTGDAAGDYTVQYCVGSSLDPGQSCTMTVKFQPQASGTRNAVLVIHQNLPPPDTGTRVDLTATGEP